MQEKNIYLMEGLESIKEVEFASMAYSLILCVKIIDYRYTLFLW